MKYILALDLGTTTAHASLIDSDGQLVFHIRKEIQSIFPHPGWVEQNPIELWKITEKIIAELIEKTKASSDQIAAIGIANQRETIVAWNKKTGEPLTNAIVWQDRRTADFCQHLKDQESEPFIRKKTGLPIDPYFSASKIHYLFNQVKEVSKLADEGLLAIGTIDSWLIWNLTQGKIHATDASNAARTMLYNIHQDKWDQDLLELFDVPQSCLPKIFNSSEVICEAKIYGISNTIPIAGVIGDQSAALFGQLCFQPGQSKTTFGTGCFTLINVGQASPDPLPFLVNTIAWKINNILSYALEGSIFMGGAVVQWLRDNLKIINSAEEIEKIALSVPDSDGVYFIPAFTGLAAPHWAPNTRGTIFGMTRATQTSHIARAALEGIVFQVADLIEHIQKESPYSMNELRVDGGASQNNFMMQFLADLLNLPVIRPKIFDTTSLGAGYLAGLGIGLWKDPSELKQHQEIDRIFEPHQSETLIQHHEKWKKAVECVKLWQG